MANDSAHKPRKKPLPYMEPFKSCGACVNGFLEDARGFAYRCQCWRVYVDRWVRTLADQEGAQVESQ